MCKCGVFTYCVIPLFSTTAHVWLTGYWARLRFPKSYSWWPCRSSSVSYLSYWDSPMSEFQTKSFKLKDSTKGAVSKPLTFTELEIKDLRSGITEITKFLDTLDDDLYKAEDKIRSLNTRQWITAASVLLIGIILFILVRT